MSDAPTLDDQVRLLVALQDLDQMIREVEDQDTSAELEKLGFSLDGMEELKAARDRLANQTAAAQPLPARVEELRTHDRARDQRAVHRVFRQGPDVIPLRKEHRDDLRELRSHPVFRLNSSPLRFSVSVESACTRPRLW